MIVAYDTATIKSDNGESQTLPHAVIFLPAIWLPHGQFWAILEGTASLIRC